MALLATALGAGCTAPGGGGPARPPVLSAPAPPPTQVVPPAEVDWRDVPLTPGTWRYVAAPDATTASYGDPAVLVVRCDLATRRVRLTVPGSTGPLTVRTSSSGRTLPADGTLAARDPFLDEMAFSRGRFSVTPAAAPALFVPAWAEPARVVEDCRG